MVYLIKERETKGCLRAACTSCSGYLIGKELILLMIIDYSMTYIMNRSLCVKHIIKELAALSSLGQQQDAVK